MTQKVASAGDGEALSAVLEEKDKKIPCEIINREKLENAQMRFTVKVSPETFNVQVQDVLKDIQKDVNIPGFRKGKAPVALIKNRFAKHTNEQAAQQLAGRLAKQIIETENLETIGQSGFDGWEIDDEKSAIVKIVYELQPEIVLNDETFKGISVEVLKRELKEEDVSAELERIRNESAIFDPAEEGATFAEKDAATLTIHAYDLQGKELQNLHIDHEYSENLENELPKEIVTALIGKKAGEVVDVSNVELGQGAQKTHANFNVTLHEIKKRNVPTLDDEFAKDVNSEYTSLEDLKKSVREDLGKRFENQERNETLIAIYRSLNEKLEFEVPLSMVHNATNRGLQRTDQQLREAYGVSLKKLGKDLIENFVARSQAEAEVEVKNSLLGQAISKYLAIEVTDAMVDEEIKKIADLQGRKPLAIRANLEAQKQLTQFEAEIKMRLTNEKLISLVDVKRVDKLTEEEPVEEEAAPETPSEEKAPEA
ncbi:MAG: trigger factor [Sumerlaeia bacterium]